MPMSQGAPGGNFGGLALKAWAQVSAAGVLIKGSNVQSVANGGAGTYTVTFTTPLSTSTYIVDAQTRGAGRSLAGTKTTGAFTGYNTLYESGAVGNQDHFIAFYE